MTDPGKFLKKSLVEKMLSAVAKSVKEDAEEVYLSCKNGKMSSLGTGERDKIEVTVPKDSSSNFCGKDGSLIFHTHGIGSGFASSADVVSSKHLFNEIEQVMESCSVGIDGIHCIGRNGKTFSKWFSQDQVNKIISGSGMKTWKGDSIFCDKIQKEPNERYLCISQLESRKEDQEVLGIFEEISMIGGHVATGIDDADLAMFSNKDDGSINCFGSTSGRKSLTCILK